MASVVFGLFSPFGLNVAGAVEDFTLPVMTGLVSGGKKWAQPGKVYVF